MGRTQDRTWQVHPDPETGLVDPQQVYEAFQDAATVMLRLGGGIMAAPQRFRHPDTGEWLTRAINFKWTSFVPPVDAPAPQVEEPLEPTADEDFAALEGEADMRELDEAQVAAELDEEPELVLE